MYLTVLILRIGILPYGSISTALFARKTRSIPALQHVSDIYTVFLFEVLGPVAEAEILPFFRTYKVDRYTTVYSGGGREGKGSVAEF